MNSPLIRFPAELLPLLHEHQRPRETLPDTIRRVLGPALRRKGDPAARS